MVEISVALQLSGSAYRMIKNGVERFFDAKESIAEANVAANSVEAQALQVTAVKHKMTYSGQIHSYKNITRLESRLIAVRKNNKNERLTWHAENKKI